MGEHDELIPEFVADCLESVQAFDDELVALEKDPTNAELLHSIFRRLHSIKGICGFFHFSALESLAHAGEDLMADIRNGSYTLDETKANLLFQTADAIRALIAQIQATGSEGENSFETLVIELRNARLASTTKPSSPTPAVSAQTPQQASSPSETTLRVDVQLLDHLMNLAGELVLARNQLLQTGKAIQDAHFRAIVHRLDAVTSELQEGVMKTRLQPISSLWDKLPRLVRDISHSTGKVIEFKATGGHTEVDKAILEAIKDPLTHLIRNAIDHGIESSDTRHTLGKPREGRLTLRAFPDGGYVIIELQDDGTGLNTQKIKQQAIARGLLNPKQTTGMSDSQIHRFIFAPGFSTADTVTAISGRGVGMDVVRTNIESIGGQIQIASEAGRGTTMRLKIPLSLSIIPTLLVSCNGEMFAMPENAVVELVKVSNNPTSTSVVPAGNANFLRLRDELLPLLSLSEYLHLERTTTSPTEGVVVVVSVEGCRFGIFVDRVHDIEEIVVKALDSRLQALMLYAGATILGDGTIVLIVDPSGMLHHLQLQRPDSIESYTPGSHATRRPAIADFEGSYLIVETSECSRTAIPIAFVKRIEKVQFDYLEAIGALWVMQYRGSVLPLINPPEEAGAVNEHDRELSIVVLGTPDGREAGLIVHSVVDISSTQADTTTRINADTPVQISIVDDHSSLILDVSRVFERLFGAQETSSHIKEQRG
jgi:two-component system chemotaxis sensor kinase CheA